MTEVGEQLKELIQKRGYYKRRLTMFINYVSTIDITQLTKPIIMNLEERVRKLEPIHDLFTELQFDIEYIQDTEQNRLEHEQFINSYFDAITNAKTIIESFNTDNSVNNNASQMNLLNDSSVTHLPPQIAIKDCIKLPTLNLLTFDGTFTLWREFIDSFNAAIHNNASLSNVQKLAYLRSSLKGEPANLLRSLETIDKNYDIAYSLLQKRYNNLRRIINNHVQELLEIPSINRESHTSLKQLINTVQNHVDCLQSLGQPVEQWDAILVPIISNKLDMYTLKMWEEKINSDSERSNIVPSLKDFLEFLYCKQDTLELISSRKGCGSFKQTPNQQFSNRNTKTLSLVTNISCTLCGKNHFLQNCEVFQKLDVNCKNNKVRELKLCVNCLRQGHYTHNCQSKSSCKKCNKRHHTLLHLESIKQTTLRNIDKSNDTSVVAEARASNQEDTINCSSAVAYSQVLLSTAQVYIADSHNNLHTVRVLLDSASQSNFITEHTCQFFNLKKEPIKMNVSGINQGSTTITHKVKITLKSRINGFSMNLYCLVLPQITSNLPTKSFDIKMLNIPPNIKLADPAFHKSQPIDILIGAELFYDLLCTGQIRTEHFPTMQKTKLGWIISGPISTSQLSHQTQNSISCLSLTNLSHIVERFWILDEFNSTKQHLTDEEIYCENHFAQNTIRSIDGNFMVKIPIKEKQLDKLGDSLHLAKCRFLALEKKLLQSPELRIMYLEFMSEYIALGHMTKISPDYKKSFFLPHHAVIKDSSETTKLRVVFDGSCNPENGLSINQIQCAGPTIQQDIFSIITKFRTHAFALTADIAKMYRQVWIHPNDRQYQRIIWRDNPESDLEIYELNTVTYGTKSAPFLAVRSLYQLGLDNEIDYPNESRIIKEDFYVDDLITGTNSIPELNTIKNNIDTILKKAGFNLRKWTSNVSELNDIKLSENNIQLSEKDNHKALGVQWNPKTDKFSYTCEFSFHKQITKRSVLAMTGQLYDPMGILAPVIVVAKLLIQELWQLKLSWDESIPLDLHTKWLKYQGELEHINQIQIPRHVLIIDPVRIELHSFCDSSERAYGCCIYLKSVNQYNEVQVSLLAAKSRVAPLKKCTIPRLELCAALLCAQITNKFKSFLNIHITNEYYWSDSKITLAWIKSPANRWKNFVANRTAEIQSLTNPNDWRHVSSLNNPADLVSRGVAPRDLINSTLWWQGPLWLSELENNCQILSDINIDNLPELRSQIESFPITIKSHSFIFDRFSSLAKLKRITALCWRFKNNCLLSKNLRSYGPLTVQEINHALTKLIKIVQSEYFATEINLLKNKKQLPSKSSLISLAPFIDEQYLLRVGGRLHHSEFNYDKKHQILLPKQHVFTKLMLTSQHVKLLHAGPKLLLSSIRERFWPINGRNLCKEIVRKCVTCFKLNAKSLNPIMGSLPKPRVTPSYPFQFTGIDYAGPFLIKNPIGRGNKTMKAYISLFICMSTKAIHLELVTSLTTDAFMSTFKRFIGRRGRPSIVYSDNGSNFLGANNEMIKLGEFLKTNADYVKNKVSDDGIDWHFIPPNSPHFGGLWEAGVKCTKHHLKRILKNIPLTFEEFYTVLVQIESVLNSRPLTPLSSDPNDLEVLTPAHFLIGRSFTLLPEPNFRETPMNRLKRHQHLQKLTQHFWSKWSKDYINELQQRTKWKTNEDILKIGTVVLIKNDNAPPARWQLGRITQLHPGHDNVARVVTVKCKSGQMKRPVSKVCVLPIDESDEFNDNIND